MSEPTSPVPPADDALAAGAAAASDAPEMPAVPEAPAVTGERTATGIAIPRRLDMGPEEAWAWITRSERTAAWFGPWSGDPASGEVTVQLLAEEGAPTSTSRIIACEAPRRLVVGTGPGWEVALEIRPLADADEDGPVVLTLSQDMDDPEMAAMVGPGWEFYLDRLVAAIDGRDTSAIAFEPAYVPGMSEHYRQLLA